MKNLRHCMEIKRTQLFKKQFRELIFHIAEDKKVASKKFKNELNDTIDNLTNFPYKYRSSCYYDDDNIRDMIFKGYTIIYRISQEKELIEILEIFNKNTPVNHEA